MKVVHKLKAVGPKNVALGFIRRVEYGKLVKKYHFDTWHLSPYEWKEYAQACVAYINAHGGKTVVDIGCGLGGVLRHVKADRRIGLDLHEEVVKAARELGGGDIAFATGSFDELEEKQVDYLVTLNFMHGGTEDTWKEPYRKAAEQNGVRYFIVDTVPEMGGSHCLDWGKILPENYGRMERMGPFAGGRYVEVWGRTDL